LLGKTCSRFLSARFLLLIRIEILFGLFPALQASTPALNETLKEGGRDSSGGSLHHRLRGLLVVSEVALWLVLLISAGLLIKSFIRLRNVDSGFDPQNVLTMEIALPASRYPDSQREACPC
jgi:putative ABC transport system permease protein